MIRKSVLRQTSTFSVFALFMTALLIFSGDAYARLVPAKAQGKQTASQKSQVSAIIAARFLEQSSWGPTPATIAAVQSAGLQGYLQQQFAAPISTYATPGLKDKLVVVQNNFFVHALRGQDQLRQRVSMDGLSIYGVLVSVAGAL
jgi:hypothetical protein